MKNNKNTTYSSISDIKARSKTVTTASDVQSIKTLSDQFRGYIVTKHL